MNLIEADVADGRVSFADIELRPPGSRRPPPGFAGRLILGIRPTDFEHASTADPRLPRLRVEPEVVEDLGAEHHVIFTVDAPRVAADAVRAAVEGDDDEGKLFADDRAVFTACVDAAAARSQPANRSSSPSTPAGLHFFDPLTGRSLAVTTG